MSCRVCSRMMLSISLDNSAVDLRLESPGGNVFLIMGSSISNILSTDTPLAEAGGVAASLPEPEGEVFVNGAGALGAADSRRGTPLRPKPKPGLR